MRVYFKKNSKTCIDEKKRECKHNGTNVCLNCSVYYGDSKKDVLFEL